jgi:predicted PurR-regulated permease PerM
MKAKTPAVRDVARTTLTVLCIVLLIAASFWILSPFLIPIIWANTIVIATWPILLWVQARLWGRRGPAVAVMTLMLLIIIVAPFSFAVATIADRADEIATLVKSMAAFSFPPPPDWLWTVPLAGPELVDRWQQLADLSSEELSGRIAPYAQGIGRWFVARAGSLGMMLLNFLMTVIISAILYAFGEKAAAMVLNFSRRLAGNRGEEAALLAAKAIRGVALGVVVTAIIQTALGGLGLVVTGVPAAALLTGVMFMLCLAQLGPGLVLLPAVIWLFWKDEVLWGSVLLVISVFAVTLDNFVRPFLIRKGANLPLIMIFAGVIGGLIAFGVVGLFIGPVVLAVTFTLLQRWISEGELQETGPPDGE